MSDKQGIAVTALMREMVLYDMGCSFEQADALSVAFDQRIKEADWLVTLEGVTFRRSWPDAPWTGADEEDDDAKAEQ